MILEFEINNQKNKIIVLEYKDNQLEFSNLLLNNYRNSVHLYHAYINSINGKEYGYIDELGNFQIEPNFEDANDFQENGIAIVELGLSGLIDQTGHYILEPTYENISPFNDQRATIVDKNGFGVIDELGKLVTNKSYDYINSYQGQRALFYKMNKDTILYGYLDINGNEVIQAIYLNGTDFINGKAVVKLKENEYYLVNPFGKILHAYKFAYVGNYGDDYLAFKLTDDGLYGYIDESGKVMISPIYTYALPFINSRAIVHINNDFYGLIDKKGNYIIKPIYNTMNYLGDDRYAVGNNLIQDKPYLGYKYALASSNGEILTKVIFTQILDFKDGVASASDDFNTYFINLNGEKVDNLPIISGQGTLAIVNGLIKVDQDFVLFYIDQLGKVIYKPNDVIKIKPTIQVVINKYKPNKDYLVYYPFLTGVNKNINQMLKIKSQVKYINPTEKLDYSYYGNFEISFYQKNLLSIKFEGYYFPFGAAHGMPYRAYCHIDLEKGVCFELIDLFKENLDYVKGLSEIISNKIKNDNKYDYLFPDAFKGIIQNQPFYVDDEALYLYFEPYDIAPYAAGFPTFKINYDEIKEFINYSGDLWKAFN
ncbi:MAG: repeat-containing protein [Haloplasmataceae bacterium]|jgi:hypothetical protein|nr:repeat-containing protein [Haloplasmataceae bacterium]